MILNANTEVIISVRYYTRERCVIDNLLLAYNVKFNDGFEFHMFTSVDMIIPELDTIQVKNILNQWIRRLSLEKPKYQIESPARFVIK